jgi:hypothetical protein
MRPADLGGSAWANLRCLSGTALALFRSPAAYYTKEHHLLPPLVSESAVALDRWHQPVGDASVLVTVSANRRFVVAAIRHRPLAQLNAYPSSWIGAADSFNTKLTGRFV